MPATFQQTFRFNYTKREDGTCSDLNAYRALLETTLELVKRHIPEICTVQDSADRITGQLMISDISEQDQHVSVLNCWLRHHIDLLRYICLPAHDCHTICCRSLGANCIVIVSYTMEQSHCRSPFVLGPLASCTVSVGQSHRSLWSGKIGCCPGQCHLSVGFTLISHIP